MVITAGVLRLAGRLKVAMAIPSRTTRAAEEPAEHDPGMPPEARKPGREAWLSADTTLQHVLAHELAPDVARTKLANRLWRGEIIARASTLFYGGMESSDAIIPSEFWNRQWRDVQIDYANNAARSRGFGPGLKPANGGMVPDYITDDNAAGIVFSKRHLCAIWPDIKAEAS
jgi:hypothetical protein